MTFTEANKKLEEIAAGKYRSIQYEETTFSDGRKEVECSLYIPGRAWHHDNTWERAFESLLGVPFTDEGRPE